MTCLAVLFGSRYLTGLAQVWEIAIFAVGVLLLAAELFITPGFGVLGLTGGLLCTIGLLASLIGNAPDELPWPSPGLMMDTFLTGLFALGVGVLAGCVLCIVAARFLPKIPIASRLMLPDVAAGPAAPSSTEAAIRRITPGDQGTVEALCRPAGKARFGEELVDVVAEGEFIEPGTSVVVTRNEGNRLVVRPSKQA